MSNSTNTILPHPYYPLGVEIVGYLENSYSISQLLVQFGLGCAIILGGTHLVVNKFSPDLQAGEKATVLWMALSGFIHFIFEGYFVLNHTSMAPQLDLFGQLWKEYSLSDSRYLISDSFIVCMETVTAVLWGPLCFLIAIFIMNQHPLRHPLQIIVSLGQLYGDVLYYATSMFELYHEGVVYCRTEGWYFWGYYFLCNFFWIVIPIVCLWSSTTAIGQAFRKVGELEKTLAKTGVTKKSI